jgi:2,3,4,5-tetrahydropyridine-2-carboxylate N-succinyltransferase
MRAGVLVLGSLLTKYGKAKVSLPGGCAIGTRPVDLHLFALKKLGAKIKIKDGYIFAEAKKGLKGTIIKFPSISVGATENALLAACKAKGKTILKNCATEPEIKDLILFLKKIGVIINLKGRKITILGGKIKRSKIIHKVIFDRIELGTYMIASALLAKKKIIIDKIDPKIIKNEINAKSDKKIIKAINETIELVDSGKIRVANKIGGSWVVNQWIKKAILLSFRVNKMVMSKGPYTTWYDKVPGKSVKWKEKDWKKAGYRHVPNGVVRRGSFIAKNVVLMPSFVNLGAYVDEGTMIDTWASVGSCAQVGKNCHISGGAGIGGVLEPLQAGPVIIEDNCFVGARSEIAEGVLVEEGAVISMGVYIGASTKIIDRSTGEITYGKVPAYSVVVPGSLPNKSNSSGPSLYCAVIVKKVDSKTRSKTSINDLLRD